MNAQRIISDMLDEYHRFKARTNEQYMFSRSLRVKTLLEVKRRLRGGDSDPNWMKEKRREWPR